MTPQQFPRIFEKNFPWLLISTLWIKENINNSYNFGFRIVVVRNKTPIKISFPNVETKYSHAKYYEKESKKKHEKWKKNIAPDVIISQKKAKLLSKKNSLCVSNYFSMGNFTKNRSWKQKSIELFFTDMVSLITKNEIVGFGIGKTMSMNSSNTFDVLFSQYYSKRKKTKSKNQFTKTIRSKTNKYQKIEKNWNFV